MQNPTICSAVLASALLLTGIADASISVVGGGDFTAQPAGWDQSPATVGGWSMTNYDNLDPFLNSFDSAPMASSDVNMTHTVTFDPVLEHRIVGESWATWSGGYNGSVYYTGPAQTNIATLTMAPGTVAFSLFFEPNAFELVDFTILGRDSDNNLINIQQNAHGDAGATWVAFYTDGTTTIDWIEVRAAENHTFAIGHFAYASTLPAPGVIAMLGIAGLFGSRRRRN